MDADVNTTIAFVQLNEFDDRSFSFLPQAGSGYDAQEDELLWDIIADSHIFHYGSISFTDDP